MQEQLQRAPEGDVQSSSEESTLEALETLQGGGGTQEQRQGWAHRLKKDQFGCLRPWSRSAVQNLEILHRFLVF